MWELWLLILVFLAIQCLWNDHFLLFPLFLSALTSLLISTFTYMLTLQLLCFLLLFSFSTLICTSFHFNPLLLSPSHTSLSQHLLGAFGVVTKPIGSTMLESGLVKLDHEKWRALSYDHRPILPGQMIKVCQIDGIHLIVCPVDALIEL